MKLFFGGKVKRSIFVPTNKTNNIMMTYRNNTINGMLKNLTLFVNSFKLADFFMCFFDVDNNKTAKTFNKTLIVLGCISFSCVILNAIF